MLADSLIRLVVVMKETIVQTVIADDTWPAYWLIISFHLINYFILYSLSSFSNIDTFRVTQAMERGREDT